MSDHLHLLREHISSLRRRCPRPADHNIDIERLARAVQREEDS